MSNRETENREEKTRPMAAQLTGIDQRIIEAAERAIARERLKRMQDQSSLGDSELDHSPENGQDHTSGVSSSAHEAIARARETMKTFASQMQEESIDEAESKNSLQEEDVAAIADDYEKRSQEFLTREPSEFTDDNLEEKLPTAHVSSKDQENLSVDQSQVYEEDHPHTSQTSEHHADHLDPQGQVKSLFSDETSEQERLADAATAMERLHSNDGINEPEHDDDEVENDENPVEEVRKEIHVPRPWSNKIVAKVKTAKVLNRVQGDAHLVNATYLDVFFKELARCGITDFVVSPGSRSTALAMKAFEHFKKVYVDVDERGAAFFALGLAKAKKRPVVVICTSGSAVANWMPAVLEAEASRVPLIFLSSDRPARLHQVGAPQTCDQLHLFGPHVKLFVNMPEPKGDVNTLRYARQMALQASIAAYGDYPGYPASDAGPVHLNFPFDEPLLPASTPTASLGVVHPLPPTVSAGNGIRTNDAKGIFSVFHGKHCIAICGEGTVRNAEDARILIEFAHRRNIPLLADPLSGLRSYNDPFIIDNYDTLLGADTPSVDVVIRFGRWPVSKRLIQALIEADPVQIVVDVKDPQDFTSTTDMMVRTLPVVFAQAMIDVPTQEGATQEGSRNWIAANEAAAEKIGLVERLPGTDEFEGAYISKLFELIPQDSLLFVANSMSIRAVDTFYRKSSKSIEVLCNRGLNGIDGTLSSAFGAAQCFSQTTLITGDLALLHDMNALALQNEMHIRETRAEGNMPSIIVVLLNNNGGAIFDMLPQKSTEDYFGRLFITPQNVDVKHVAQAFGVDYRRVDTVHDFRRVYQSLLGEAGISIIDISLPLAGVKERYNPYW